MSEHDFTSQKVIHPDEDSNPATPPLPQDSGSASSNTSISTDLPLSQDVGSQSSERVSISAATPGVVRSPVPEAAVSTDPPVKGDTRSLSSSDYVSAVTATLSPEDSKHPQETELSPWLAWYLQKDIEWRKRLQEQCESRSRRLLQLEMSVQLKAKQKAEAERVFRSWCKMKTEERREAVFEKQRRQMDLEADKLRKKQRLREQSKHKYREWLETKKEQGQCVLRICG
ncbi:unnamed protein product [Ixodes hexagonus]